MKVGDRKFNGLADIAWIIAVFIIACAAYLNSLPNDFVWDAVPEIKNNLFIRDWANLPAAFSVNFHGMYRPLELVTYFFDYRIWGLNPAGFHLTGIILHAIVCVLIFIFFRLFMGERVAFLGAVLFAVTPMHTEAVAWIAARDDIIMAGFFMGALIYFIRAINRGKGFFTPVLLYVCALLSKETAIIFPLVILTYNGVFPAKTVNKIKEIRVIILTLFLVSLVYVFVRANVLHIVTQEGSFSGMQGYLKTIFAMPAIIIYYLIILFFPVNLCPSYGFEHFAVLPIAIHLFSWILVAGFIAALFFLKRKFSKVVFGIFFFFIALSPSLNIIPKCQLVSERYLYLPSVGFFMTVALLVSYIYSRIKNEQLKNRLEFIFIALSIIIIGLYSSLTLTQNKIWATDDTLRNYTVGHSLADLRLIYNSANESYKNKDLESAIIKYNRVLKLKPNAEVFNNLGIVYESLGLRDKASDCFFSALKLDSNLAQAHNNLGTLYYKEGELEKALFEYKEALKGDPSFAFTYNNIGLIYVRTGRYSEAEYMYKKALSVKPDYENAAENLKNLKLICGKIGIYLKEVDNNDEK